MKDSQVRYLVDAGPLVGAFWAADQWHAWSRGTLESIGQPVYTSESVFAEAAHHLKRHLPALMQLVAAFETGLVRFIPLLPLNAIRAAEIVSRYAPFADWGDASLVILSERHPRARVITVDVRDFTIYRRWDGSRVPCIMPAPA